MNTQVVLLSAGSSTRTWPISEKIFFQIFGKTILEHQINTLKEAGFHEIIIVCNSQNKDRISEICSQIQGCRFVFCIQKNLSEGQRGGILAAEKVVNDKQPILVVCSNDIVNKSAFINVLQKANNSHSEIFFVGKKVNKYFPGGYLSLSSKKMVTKIVEKPGEGNEPSDLVTLLIHFYKNPQRLFSALKEKNEGDGYEDVLQNILDSGCTAEVSEYSGFWQAIKYPWHFLDISHEFLSQFSQSYIHPSAEISPKCSLNGKVYISEGVQIMDFAVLSGNVYVGKNSIVGNHVLIRDSHIGNHCVIGHSSEIARSVLSDDCWTHQNYVGDSVFDSNVSLGSGTKTGNLRLDEKEIVSEIKGEKVCSQKSKLGAFIGKNVRVGINTSIMPGVKIGGGSFIGAHFLCDSDIPEKKFTYQKTPVVSKKNQTSSFIRKI
jgi:NDP-sugar pyrophosphorylase family protein